MRLQELDTDGQEFSAFKIRSLGNSVAEHDVFLYEPRTRLSGVDPLHVFDSCFMVLAFAVAIDSSASTQARFSSYRLPAQLALHHDITRATKCAMLRASLRARRSICRHERRKHQSQRLETTRRQTILQDASNSIFVSPGLPRRRQWLGTGSASRSRHSSASAVSTFGSCTGL